jgi:hypothetical protein
LREREGRGVQQAARSRENAVQKASGRALRVDHYRDPSLTDHCDTPSCRISRRLALLLLRSSDHRSQRDTPMQRPCKKSSSTRGSRSTTSTSWSTRFFHIVYMVKCKHRLTNVIVSLLIKLHNGRVFQTHLFDINASNVIPKSEILITR